MQPGRSATTTTSDAVATTAATETAAVRPGAPVPTAQLLAVARRSVRAHPVTPSHMVPVVPVGMMNGTPVH
jgi:hypothetical protein